MRKWVVAKYTNYVCINTNFKARNKFTANIKAILITRSFKYILEEKKDFLNKILDTNKKI